MFLLYLFLAMWGVWWVVEIAFTCLGGFLVGGSNAEKWGDHRKKNFFINNSMGLSMFDLDAVVPDQLLAANADAVAYQMEEYKN